MRYTRILLFIISCIPVRGIAGDPVFTMEQILSSPFPSSLVASPKGQAFAWVFREKGVHNIRIAEGEAFRSRRLTEYEKDDGRSLTILGFTRDGEKLVFVRRGRNNPAHAPEGAPGDALLWIDRHGGEPVKIASSGRATLSPATDEVAFVKDNAIWTVGLSKKAEPVNEVTVTGQLQPPRWAPDGKSYVFTNTRNSYGYNYSYIALFDRAAGTVRFLDASVYEDSRPNWSLDGRKVAFLRRLGGEQKFTTTALDFPQPDPVEIRVTEVATGYTVSAWRSSDEENSWFLDLAWLDAHHLVFTSERTGWRHLYSVSEHGGEVRPLTAGAFEVESFYAQPELGKVFYSANDGDPDRRHLAWVGLDGKPHPLTKGKGIEWAPTPSADGLWLAWIGSDAREPAQTLHRQVTRTQG